MKYFTLLILSVLCYSCSSSSSDKKSTAKSAPTSEKVVQVDFLDKKELRRQGVNTDSHSFEKAILNTGFATKKEWYKMQKDFAEYNTLMDKPVPELKSMLERADAKRATLLIEVLSQKGATAVSAVIGRLKDTRHAYFKDDKKIYWYEEKNKPPQELELRLFAAMHLEKMVNTSPYGVSFDFHKIRTDKGPVDVLYAVKGSYAVNKEDVCKNWLKWWNAYGSDYK